MCSSRTQALDALDESVRHCQKAVTDVGFTLYPPLDLPVSHCSDSLSLVACRALLGMVHPRNCSPTLKVLGFDALLTRKVVATNVAALARSVDALAGAAGHAALSDSIDGACVRHACLLPSSPPLLLLRVRWLGG